MSESTSYSTLEIRIFPKSSQGYPVEMTWGATSYPRKYINIDDMMLRRYALNAEKYGRYLGELLFAPDILGADYAGIATAVQHATEKLRVRLRIDPDELQSVSWERLYHPWNDDWQPLATMGGATLSRFVRASGAARFKPIAHRPLKLLLIIASASDIENYQLAPIPQSERADLINTLEALEEFSVTILESGKLHPPTLQNIREELANGYDIVHIVAHGGLDEEDNETWIYLDGENGKTKPVAGSELINSFQRLERPPMLVFLMSCNTAKRSRSNGRFVPLGPALVQRGGVEAVLAMSDTVLMETARIYARNFYKQLAQSGIVDEAANEARQIAIDQWDWSVPVLFMRTSRGQIVLANGARGITAGTIQDSEVNINEGGVNFHGTGTINIGGSVAGRDMVIHNHGDVNTRQEIAALFDKVNGTMDGNSSPMKPVAQMQLDALKGEADKGGDASEAAVQTALQTLKALLPDVGAAVLKLIAESNINGLNPIFKEVAQSLRS